MQDDKNDASGWPLGDAPGELEGLWKLTGAWRGIPEPEVDGALERLHDRLTGEQLNQRRAQRRRWSLVAAVLLLLAAGLVFRLNIGMPDGPQVLQTAQEVATIELPDGSRVQLNKHSELRWEPNHFDSSERLVRLKGEALFEVQPNTERPFRVLTESMEVRVTGTSFNVRAYPQEEEAEVAVLTGHVTLHAGTESLPLVAEQSARWTPETGPQLEAMNVHNAIAWKTGELAFREAPLQEVVHQLEHFFGVQIEWPATEYTSEAPCTVSAIWRNPELDQVLTALEKLTGLQPEQLSTARYRLVGQCSR